MICPLIEKWLKARLVASSAIVALVPAPRIFAYMADTVSAETFPYIVYNYEGGEQERAGAEPTILQARYKVVAWARLPMQAAALRTLAGLIDDTVPTEQGESVVMDGYTFTAAPGSPVSLPDVDPEFGRVHQLGRSFDTEAFPA